MLQALLCEMSPTAVGIALRLTVVALQLEAVPGIQGQVAGSTDAHRTAQRVARVAQQHVMAAVDGQDGRARDRQLGAHCLGHR